MPMTFLKGERNNRLAFLFGRQTGIRSTNNAIEQLQQQLECERRAHAFVVARMEEEQAILIRDLAQARLELAQRDVALAFAAVPSPSQLKH